jgi:hypothetical protein
MKKPPKSRNKATKQQRDDFEPMVLYFPEPQENQESRQILVAKPSTFVAILVTRIRQFAKSFRRSPREA